MSWSIASREGHTHTHAPKYSAVHEFTLRCTCARVRSGIPSCALPQDGLSVAVFIKNKTPFVLTPSCWGSCTCHLTFKENRLYVVISGYSEEPLGGKMDVNSGHAMVEHIYELWIWPFSPSPTPQNAVQNAYCVLILHTKVTSLHCALLFLSAQPFMEQDQNTLKDWLFSLFTNIFFHGMYGFKPILMQGLCFSYTQTFCFLLQRDRSHLVLAKTEDKTGMST